MTSPRRIVLLPVGADRDAPHERVLAEPPATEVERVLRRAAKLYAGRWVCAEWLYQHNWTRWIWCKEGE